MFFEFQARQEGKSANLEQPDLHYHASQRSDPRNMATTIDHQVHISRKLFEKMSDEISDDIAKEAVRKSRFLIEADKIVVEPVYRRKGTVYSGTKAGDPVFWDSYNFVCDTPRKSGVIHKHKTALEQLWDEITDWTKNETLCLE